MKTFQTIVAFIALQVTLANVPLVVRKPSFIASIRGGAGPIDPVVATKVMGSVLIFEGTREVLAPHKSFKTWSEKELNPCNAKTFRRTGISFLNIGIHIYCLVFRGFDIKVSTAINSFIWIADLLSSLLNKESETIGPGKPVEIVLLGLCSTLAYSALYNVPWFGKYFKASSIFLAVSELPCVIKPQMGCELVGLKGMDDLTPASGHCLGLNLISSQIFNACLASGVEPVTAFGYSALIGGVAFNLKAMFFSPETDKLELNKGAASIWTALWAITAVTILL